MKVILFGATGMIGQGVLREGSPKRVLETPDLVTLADGR